MYHCDDLASGIYGYEEGYVKFRYLFMKKGVISFVADSAFCCFGIMITLDYISA